MLTNVDGIGGGKRFIVRGPNLLSSLLCLLCCTMHAKTIGDLGACPQKMFEIACFEIDFGGIFTYENSQVSTTTFLNLRLK